MHDPSSCVVKHMNREEFKRWVKCWEKDYDNAYKEFNSQKVNELESMLCL